MTLGHRARPDRATHDRHKAIQAAPVQIALKSQHSMLHRAEFNQSAPRSKSRLRLGLERPAQISQAWAVLGWRQRLSAADFGCWEWLCGRV
jgi:hypothetical protein